MAVSRIIIIPVLAAIVCLCYCEARYPQLELTQQQHQQQQQQQQQSIINTHPNEIEAAENSELVLSRKKRFALISYIALIFILVNVVMMVMSNIFVDIQHVGMDDNNNSSNNNDDSPIFTMIDKFEALVRDHQESTTTTLEPLTWTSERTTTTTLTPTPIPPLYLQGRNDDSDEGDLTISAEMEHNQMLREILKNKFRLNTLQGEEREKLLAVLTEQRQRLMGYTSTSSATTTTTIATTTTTTTSTASSTTATTTTTTTTTTLPKILVFLENEGNEEEEFNSADEDLSNTVSTEIDVLPVKRPFPWTFTETPQNENDDDYNYEESNRNDFTFDYSKWLQRHAGSNKILQKGRQHHQERQKRSAAVNEGDEEEELDSADEDLSNMVSTEIDVRPGKRWPFTKTPRNENDDNYNYEKSNRNHFTFDYSKWLQQHAGSNKILQKSRQHHQERVKRTSFPVHQPQPTSSSPVLPPSIGILGLIVLLINGIWYLSSKSSATTTASSLLPSDTAAVLPEKTANSDKTLKLVQLLEDFAYDIINDLFGEGASDNLTSTTTTTAPTTQIYVTRDFLYSSSTTATTTTTTTTKTTTTATTTTPTPRTTDKNVLMFTLPTEPPFIKDGDDSNDVMDIAPIYTPATLTKSTPSDLDKVTSTKKVPRTYKRPSPASNGVVSIRADPFSSKIVIDDEFADEELEVRPWVVFSSLKMTSSVTSEEAESREDYAPQKFSSPEKKSSKKNNVMKQLMRQKGQQLLAQGDVISDRGNLGQPAEKQELWQILGKKKRKRK